MQRRWISASLLSRYTAFLCCLLLAALSLWYLQTEPRAPWPLAMLALGSGLSLVGISDLLQERRAVLRNYPVIGHIRYLVERDRKSTRLNSSHW